MTIAPVLLMALVLGPAADHPTAVPVSLSARSTAPWSSGEFNRPLAATVRRAERSIGSAPQSSFRGVRPNRAGVVVIGTVIGLVAGAMIGAALDANAPSDSPGFGGLLVGAAIGGVVGGVATVRLTR